MKKYALLIVFSVLMICTGSLVAQKIEKKQRGSEVANGDRKPMSPEVKADEMAKSLDLSDDVKVKLKELFVVQAQKSKEFRASVSKDSPDFQEKMKEFRKNEMDELKAVLGDAKFQKYMKERKDRMPQKKQ